MRKNDWIFGAIGVALIIMLGFGCAAKAPCSWYDNVPNKNVPNRCVKR